MHRLLYTLFDVCGRHFASMRLRRMMTFHF